MTTLERLKELREEYKRAIFFDKFLRPDDADVQLLDAAITALEQQAPVEKVATGYTGEIKVGGRFIWEPRNPRAFEQVEVIAMRNGWVQTRTPDGREHWNEEDRFREACVPAPSSTTRQET